MNTDMNKYKHKHLTFIMKNLLKRGHFVAFFIQLAHLKSKLPKFENVCSNPKKIKIIKFSKRLSSWIWKSPILSSDLCIFI